MFHSYVFVEKIPKVYYKQKVSKINHKVMKFEPKKFTPP